MIHWIVLISTVIILYILIGIIHIRHKIWTIVAVVLFLVGYFAFAYISLHYTINLKSPSGLIEAGKISMAWISQAFTNIKTITTSAVDMDWTPEVKEGSTASQRSDESKKVMIG